MILSKLSLLLFKLFKISMAFPLFSWVDSQNSMIEYQLFVWRIDGFVCCFSRWKGYKCYPRIDNIIQNLISKPGCKSITFHIGKSYFLEPPDLRSNTICACSTAPNFSKNFLSFQFCVTCIMKLMSYILNITSSVVLPIL